MVPAICYPEQTALPISCGKLGRCPSHPPDNLTTDTCKHKTKIYNNSGGEKVKVWFNVSGGSAPTCDIRVQIYDDDANEVLDWSKSTHSGTSSVAKSFSIAHDDNITTIVTYSNCT